MVTQLSEVLGAKGRQLVPLPVRPQILDRIQFRRIAEKKLYPQPIPTESARCQHYNRLMAQLSRLT
jgi:hypothetical protein